MGVAHIDTEFRSYVQQAWVFSDRVTHEADRPEAGRAMIG